MVRMALQSQKRPKPQMTRAQLWPRTRGGNRRGLAREERKKGVGGRDKRDRSGIDCHSEDLAFFNRKVAEPETGRTVREIAQVGGEFEDRVGAHSGGTNGEETGGHLGAGRSLRENGG